MFGFHSRKVRLGIDIMPSEVRLAVIAGQGRDASVPSLGTESLPDGMLNESYNSLNIADPDGFSRMLRELILRTAPHKEVRAAVSLPDSLFRLQTFEFDELPARAADRDRLIRWRFEKSAAFDTTDTLLRYQVLQKKGKGILLLSCFAKRSVIRQYDDLFVNLGLEPWYIGPSSLSLLNFYFSFMSERSAAYAMAAVSSGSFASLVVEQGGVRFYRYKEVRAGKPEEVRDRLVRELDDSIHFFVHADRSQASAIDRLYLSGDGEAVDLLAPSLTSCLNLPVEVLMPSAVIPSLGERERNVERSGNMAAALGAGGMI